MIGRPAATAAIALAMSCLVACATNPVTGRRELMLVSETQEIQLGRQADGEIQTTHGLYADERLQSYVRGLGRGLAQVSERPSLPWTFHVVDDPVVNAFALPGGFVYVTRGLLSHLNSEAELVAVMAHEVGHIAARHSARRLSQAQFATLGLGLGMIIEPELRRFGGAAETGLGLLFLKFSRDDERQADDVALGYMIRADYDPMQMIEVFQTLDRVGRDGNRLPGWLSTHPSPEDRIARITDRVGQRDSRGRRIERSAYLARIDGMVFGENPNEGYFKGNVFTHPELRFRFEFPAGWTTQNTRRAVSAASPQQDALVVITLTSHGSAREAAQAFLAQPGVSAAGSTQGAPNQLPGVMVPFQAASGGRALFGLAAFAEHGNRVFQILAYTLEETWGGYDGILSGSLASFAPLSGRRIRDVQPRRLEIVQIERGMSLSEFARRHPSAVDMRTLALLNGVEVEGVLPGREAKRVVGGAEWE